MCQGEFGGGLREGSGRASGTERERESTPRRESVGIEGRDICSNRKDEKKDTLHFMGRRVALIRSCMEIIEAAGVVSLGASAAARLDIEAGHIYLKHQAIAIE